jgi:hypothetical protein
MDAIPLLMDGLMCVSAEDTVDAALPRIVERARCHFRRHAQPARVQPVNQPRHRIALQIELLQLQIQRCSHLTQPDPIHLKAVELVAVNRDVPSSAEFPGVVLIDLNADQVRHNVGQSVVVIALDPDDFNVSLGIRELADIAQKLPVVFGEPGKIEVGEDVAQQDQPLEAILLEHARRLARMTRLCTQVQVGEDQRVVHVQIHDSVLPADC